MALKAGYVGVKRWLYEKLQATTSKNVQDIADIWTNGNIVNAKNLLPNNLVNKTDQGVTFTHNDDGTISLSGTASANVDAAIYDTRDSGELWRGLTLIVSKGLEDANISIYVNAYNDTTFVKTLLNLASGTESAPLTLDYNGYNRVRVTAYVKNGTNTTGKKIYPMFRLATDPDDTYVSYAKTNRQLTADIATDAATLDAHKTTINGIISAATGAADFAAFKTAMAALTPLTRSAAPDTREASPEVIEDEPVTKTTRSTKKTAITKEGE